MLNPIKPCTLEPLSNGHFGKYTFKWFVPCIEVVRFKRFQSHYIDTDRGDKFGGLVLSVVERYLMQCPFLGASSLRGSSLRGSTVLLHIRSFFVSFTI